MRAMKFDRVKTHPLGLHGSLHEGANHGVDIALRHRRPAGQSGPDQPGWTFKRRMRRIGEIIIGRAAHMP